MSVRRDPPDGEENRTKLSRCICICFDSMVINAIRECKVEVQPLFQRGDLEMPYGNGTFDSSEIETLEEEQTVNTDTTTTDNESEEISTFEGEDFTKYVKVKYLTPEEVKRVAAEERAKERPIDYRYIDRMKKEGVTEELAVRAFIGSFGGNEYQTQFFLNSRFYYGSDAPTPLDRLRKAVREDKIAECIAMLEGTKEGLERGDHF